VPSEEYRPAFTDARDQSRTSSIGIGAEEGAKELVSKAPAQIAGKSARTVVHATSLGVPYMSFQGAGTEHESTRGCDGKKKTKPSYLSIQREQ